MGYHYDVVNINECGRRLEVASDNFHLMARVRAFFRAIKDVNLGANQAPAQQYFNRFALFSESINSEKSFALDSINWKAKRMMMKRNGFTRSFAYFFAIECSMI